MSTHSHRHEMKVYGGIKIFAGSASKDLAKRIAELSGADLCDNDFIEFPNENLFIKLKQSVRGQDVYVIQTTSSPVHRNLMELLIMLQTLRLDSAARITAVVPYLAYGRSDKKDQPRVPITARLIADMFEVAGADRYITLDPHAGQIQGFFSIPGDVLTTFHLIIKHIKENLRDKMTDPVTVTVDLGFAKKGRNLAQGLNTPIAFIEKRRTGNDAKAEALSVIGDVKDRDVILVDDEIDTGGSITQAVNLVKEQGAKDVYVVCIHAVLSQEGAKRLSSAPIKHFITTDSVPMPEEKSKLFGDRLTVLTVADLLAEVITRAHEGRSVGEMFNE